METGLEGEEWSAILFRKSPREKRVDDIPDLQASFNGEEWNVRGGRGWRSLLRVNREREVVLLLTVDRSVVPLMMKMVNKKKNHSKVLLLVTIERQKDFNKLAKTQKYLIVSSSAASLSSSTASTTTTTTTIPDEAHNQQQPAEPIPTFVAIDGGGPLNCCRMAGECVFHCVCR